jgi:hypothetical protein
LYGSAVSAPTARSQALCAIKSDFLNLIHQADVVVNGKPIEQCQPFINMCRHFQLISEMSANDVATLGHSIGFAPTLDNPKSALNMTKIMQLLLQPLLLETDILIIVYLALLQIIK